MQTQLSAPASATFAAASKNSIPCVTVRLWYWKPSFSQRLTDLQCAVLNMFPFCIEISLEFLCFGNGQTEPAPCQTLYCLVKKKLELLEELSNCLSASYLARSKSRSASADSLAKEASKPLWWRGRKAWGENKGFEGGLKGKNLEGKDETELDRLKRRQLRCLYDTKQWLAGSLIHTLTTPIALILNSLIPPSTLPLQQSSP